MRVLILSPYQNSLEKTIHASGDETIVCNEEITADVLDRTVPAFIVCYGYRLIIPAPIVSRYQGYAVNLHISLLPWNRGSDPNLWSWIDRTPKGVTVHLIDRGIDTGDILIQEETIFSENETLASSYEKLRRHIEALFARSWPSIRSGKITPHPQLGEGSYHRSNE